MLKRTETIHGEPEGVGDLVHRLVEDGKAYAKAEVAYYKTLGSEKAAALKTPLILGVVALLFAHAAFLALIATLFVGLASLMSDTLAGLLTVLICLGIAGALGYVAYNKATTGLKEAQ
jgi:drug/metabolite transporter (DMT)-like permease